MSIAAAGSIIFVDSSTVACDAREFMKLAHSEQFDQAIKIYHRPFVEDGLIPPSKAFEDWCDSVRQTVDKVAARVLRRALDRAKLDGNWFAVEALADRLIGIDQFDESHHASRLSAMAAAGRPDLAISAYHNLVEQFRAELGKDPSHPELMSVARLSMQPSPSPFVRFVGRALEYRELSAEWADVCAGRLRIVSVCGEAGIGKSRLAEHFMRYLAIRGARTFVGRCIPQEASLPFAAFANALRDGLRTTDFRRLDSETLRSLRPLIGDSFLGEPEAADKSSTRDARFADLQVADACVRLLDAMTQRSPLVILLEDVHWADDGSTLLLSYVRARLTDAHVLLLFTCRREDLDGRPVAQFLTSGPTRGPHRVLDLGPLSRPECWDLFDSFESISSLKIEPVLREALLNHVGGHPFFIVEALKDYRVGRLRFRYANSTEGSEAEIQLPRASADLVRTRFARLSAAAWRVVEVLAIADFAVTVPLIRAATSLSVREIADVVHELLGRGIVVEDEGGLRVAHRLLGEAAREIMPRARRQHLHSRVGDYLAQLPTTTAAELVVHFAAAGDTERAHLAQLKAADIAVREHAYSTAEYYIRQAVGSASSAQARVAAERRLLQLLVQSSRMSMAFQYAVSLRSHFAEMSDAEGLVMCDAVVLCDNLLRAVMPSSVIQRDALNLVFRSRSLENAELLALVMAMLAESAHDAGREEFLIHFTRGLRHRATDAGVSPAGAMFYALAARLGCLYTSASKAVDDGAKAVGIANAVGDAPLLVNCLIGLATARMRSGALLASLGTFEEALAVTTERNVEYLQRRVANNYAVCLMELGQEAKAIGILHEWLSGADMHDRLFLEGNLALALLAMNRFSDAARIGEGLIGRNQVLKMPWLEAFALTLVGLDGLARGDLETACDCAEQTRKIVGNRRFMVSDQSHVDGFIAKVDASNGELDRALRRLDLAYHSSSRINFGGAMRLQLSQVELLLAFDRPRALDVARNLRSTAEKAGASSIVLRLQRIVGSPLTGR
jgi:tetratricopeptide (TPR) repeat protein